MESERPVPGEGPVGAENKAAGGRGGPPWAPRWSESGGLKLMVLGGLVLLLLIPVGMVQSLVRERARRQARVVEEVTRDWAGEQILAGPILTVPCRPTPAPSAGVAPAEAGQPPLSTVPCGGAATPTALHLLPADLAWSGRITPQVRYRGIFEVVVYEVELRAEGVFEPPDAGALGLAAEDALLWQRAAVAVGLSEPRGLVESARLAWAGQEIDFRPGPGSAQLLAAGLHAPVPDLDPRGAPIPFAFELVLRGSGRLSFVPLGKETRLDLTSAWLTPGFVGAFLPRHRAVGAGGFEAAWQVPYFGRSYPQSWVSGEVGEDLLQASAFGAELVLPADGYQRTERSVKYAVLFILLTFLTFFLLEMLSPRRLHAMHYLLVGFALCLFYVLVLAVSEHLGFRLAYVLAAVATTGLISSYAWSILASGRWALLLFACLGGLYGYLYGLLQAEDLALLLGAVGLFLILALVMVLTRKLDWRNLRFAPAERAVDAAGGE